MQTLPWVSNPWPPRCVWPRMAMNTDQHEIISLLKTFFFYSLAFINICVAHNNSSSSSMAQRRQKVGHPCHSVLTTDSDFEKRLLRMASLAIEMISHTSEISLNYK